MFKHINCELGDISTKDDVPSFDYTKLSAINTCPRWGIIRYHKHLRMPGADRVLALEIGGAAHQAYEAIRWYQLYEYGPDVYTTDATTDAFESIIEAGLKKALGDERGSTAFRIITSAEDRRQRVTQLAIYVAETSGYYDDPSDKRRTLSNLCDSLVGYIDRIDLSRYVPYWDSTSNFVGIELPFKMKVYRDGKYILNYTGKIDGLMLDREIKCLAIEDNKTCARMDNAWIDSWNTSHQVSGYCVAGALLADLTKPLDTGYILGMTIPLPKSYDMGGVARISCNRSEFRFLQWEKWLLATYDLFNLYKDDPLSAPEYTHSCNRYFRTCSFLPLCDAIDQEDQDISYSQLEYDEWSPLKELGVVE